MTKEEGELRWFQTAVGGALVAVTEEHDRALLLLEQIADALRRPISEDEEDAVVELIEAAFARESATSRASALSDATTRLLTFEPSARSHDYYRAGGEP